MNRFLALVLVTSSVVGACRSAPAESTAATSAPSSTYSVPAEVPSAPAKLDRLDMRAPVPLSPMMANHQKQNMREHLVAVQKIIAGVAANDFDGIAPFTTPQTRLVMRRVATT